MEFLSTYEKQLDGKRRVIVPETFRAAAAGAGTFEGVFLFPSIEEDCLEGGGQALFDHYRALIDELAFGHPLRSALETSVLGGLSRLSWDTAGRIVLPETLCREFGLTDWVALVGMGERFQIWPLEAWKARRSEARLTAREQLIAYRNAQQAAKLGALR